MFDEEWRPVARYEGVYEVSSQGRVRRIKPAPGVKVGRVLRPSTATRYLTVALSQGGKPKTHYVHRLVCESFHGPPPFEGAHVLHWDDDRENNTPGNLRWGTVSENMHDAVRNGGYRNGNTGKTHCIRGHKLPESRKCLKCLSLAQDKRRVQGLPEGDPRHGTLTGYTFWSCRCDKCRGCQREYDSRRNRSRREQRLRGD